MSPTHCMTCRPAFLVEGSLEQEFIRNMCVGAPVRRLECNGDDVAIAAIAKRVGLHGRMLQKRGYNPIVVVFDRERRMETSEELEGSLIASLASEGLTAKIIVSVPDRDIEVWMIADQETFRISAAIRADRQLLPCEGHKGKALIKQLLKDDARPYVETVDGPIWLKKARALHIAANSRSFARLASALKDIGCWWLDQRQLV